MSDDDAVHEVAVMSEAGRATTRARWDLPLLIGGVAVSTIGNSLTTLAVSLHLRPLGPVWVAAAMAAGLLPTVLLAAVAGSLVDRVPNRELLIGGLVTQASAIAFAAMMGLHPGSPWVLIAALAVFGSAASVNGPVVAALLPRVAGEAKATRAYGWMSALKQSGFLAGFALAGFLLQATSIRTVLLLATASIVVLAIAVTAVRTQRIPRVQDKTAGDASVRWAGFVHIRADRVLLVGVSGLALMLLAGFVANVAEVFFILEDVGASPATFGLVTACWPAAGMAGGWAAGRVNGDRPLLAVLACGITALGMALLLVGTVVSLPTLVIGWIIGGIANAAGLVAINALIRSRTNDSHRGRVFAAVAAAFQLASVLGLAIATAVVSVIGARWSLISAGIAAAAIGIGAWTAANKAF